VICNALAIDSVRLRRELQEGEDVYARRGVCERSSEFVHARNRSGSLRRQRPFRRYSENASPVTCDIARRDEAKIVPTTVGLRRATAGGIFMSHGGKFICCLLVAAGVIQAAPAQAATAAPAPTPASITTTSIYSTAEDNFIERLMERLRGDGVSLRLVWANDFAESVRGGERTGGANAGGVVFGADLDLFKMIAIEGAKIHITFARYCGHSVANNDIGIIQKIQGYWYPQPQLQLAQLSWEQDFLSSHINVLAGRVNATWLFARSNYGCRFVSAPDCPNQLADTTGGFSGFPYVNWGARMRYQPDARYIAIGAFEINPDRRYNDGLDWGVENATGVLVPVEVGYETSFATDAYPRTLKLGGWYNSSGYTDPQLNTRGMSRVLFHGAARSYKGGRYGVYALGDKVVWKPEPTTNTRNLTLFGSFIAPLDDAEIYTLQSIAGFVWNGPLASRPDDSLNFQATWFMFSNKQAGFEDDLLRKAKSRERFSRNEFMFELNYSYSLLPSLSIVPNLQYIVHPDVLGRPTGIKDVPSNALALGLRVMFNMGGLGAQ